MKILTPCIIMTGALATSVAAAGCSDEMPMDGQGGSEGADDGPCADGPCDDGPEDSGPGSSTADAGYGVGGCPARTRISVATHIVVAVSWPGSLAIEAGQGAMHLWTKGDLTLRGSVLVGAVRPCGSVIPALTKPAFVGGGQVQIQFPSSVWDAPGMPVFQVRGTLDGPAVGATIAMEPVASVVGLTMSNPLHDPWPPRAAQLRTADHDGDGRPGIKAIPRTDPPFSAPPVDLAGVLDPNGLRADEIDLATRVVVTLEGTRDSCASARGTAEVSRIDSHVVGCHIRGGGACTAVQADFIDIAQPIFDIGSATFEMIDVPAKATCADVRAALPDR